MEELNTLFQLNLSSILFSIFIILSAVIAGAEMIGKFSEIIGKPVGWIKRKNEDHKLLIQTINNLNALQTKQEEDKKQSIKHDNLIKDDFSESLSVISRKIDDMQRSIDERFLESEQRNNKRIRAELKDKISQSYRYYHALGKINDMELEALEDLIEEYEAAAGENSFVHSVVQKEMYTWEKI